MADDSQNHPDEDFQEDVQLAVQEFQSEKIEVLVNTIEKFREIGVAKIIDLPQLVVTGNQSAGKSSVLENLTGLPFPIGATTCTRFATEINFHRGPSRVEAHIRDPENRENGPVNGFTSSYEPHEFSRAQFTELLDEVSKYFGIPSPNDQGAPGTRHKNEKMFDSKMLVINVTGPTENLLSFIDTPGLIMNGNSPNEAPMISNLVETLIRPSRALIVTVMDARQNVELQGIINLAKKVDPEGVRTIGVLTHCDALQEGGETDQAVLLANNETRRLKNGWFVVRNKSGPQHEKGMSLEEARNDEAELFSQPPWCYARPRGRGIDKLRDRLTELFAEHVSAEFPKVMNEIRAKLNADNTELRNLGISRETAKQQRHFLSDLSLRYQTQTDFYRSYGIWYHVKPLIEEFKIAVGERGSEYQFKDIPAARNNEEDSRAGRTMQEYRSSNSNQDTENANDIYLWINRHYHEYAGGSCHGLVPPHLVDDLFRKLTVSWRDLGLDFVKKVSNRLKLAASECLEKVCADVNVRNRLAAYFENYIDSTYLEVQHNIDRWLDREQNSMYAVNDEFANQKFAARVARLAAALSYLADNTYGDVTDPNMQKRVGSVSLDDLIKHVFNQHAQYLSGTIGQIRDSVYDIHDTLKIYHTIAKQRFLDNMVQLCNNMVLGAESPLVMFSQSWIDDLSDVELDRLASEDAHDRRHRQDLVDRISQLNEALEIAQARTLGIYLHPNDLVSKSTDLQTSTGAELASERNRRGEFTIYSPASVEPSTPTRRKLDHKGSQESLQQPQIWSEKNSPASTRSSLSASEAQASVHSSTKIGNDEESFAIRTAK